MRTLCERAVKLKYDDADRDKAIRIMEFELASLKKTEMAFHVLMTKELMEKAQLRACDISTRGTGSGSIILYLLDVTEIDPVKYHLSPETIYGYEGARAIDIDVNVPSELQNKLQGLMRSLEGIGDVVHAGTVKTISHYKATELIDQYEQYNHLGMDLNDCERVFGKLSGNYTGRGKHPGGMLLIPRDCDYVKDMPICMDPSGSVCTYYDFFFVDRAFFKADVLTSNTLNALRNLAIRTGIDLSAVPVCSEEALSQFLPDDDGKVTKCAEFPDFRSEYVREMMAVLKPASFLDLVKILGLSHATGAWQDFGEKLVNEKGLKLQDLIADRDDVFDYLLSKGIERAEAFAISEAVRKGSIARKRNAKWNGWKEDMIRAGVPEWYLSLCQHINYLFPRAHSISYVIMNMRLAWFKVHFPEEFATVMSEQDF